jgi:hypothetical protein
MKADSTTVKADAPADSTARGSERKDSDPAPSYDHIPPDLTAGFANLNLADLSPVPTPDRCIAHLKLLEALHQLREDTGMKDGLFGLSDGLVPATINDEEKSRTLAKMREKRWAIYVARASKRFESWWDKCIQPARTMITEQELVTPFFQNIADTGNPMPFTQDTLPPLGMDCVLQHMPR